ncbi:MAG: hypothetical protein E7549_05760 [Ruminococcaceae bacterium]|nr:hypothetical protein [Oscillospiraceae bacterium]
MFIKLCILVISIVISIVSLVELNRIPYPGLTLHQNYWKIMIFSSIGWIYDLILFVVIGQMIPPGEYGTGYEVLAVIVVLIIYTPICVVTSLRLKRRMKNLEKEKSRTSRINCLNASVVIKVMFIFLLTIWIVEV